MLSHNKYVPCLRWKVGEYQSVFQLSEKEKKSITSLIEVPEFNFGFEENKKPKTIFSHLEPFAKRVHEKWGEAPCFIDMKHITHSDLMKENHKHPIESVFHSLLEMNCTAIAVTSFDRGDDYKEEIKKVYKKNLSFGLCLRLRLEVIAKESFKTELEGLLKELNIKIEQIDLILDLEGPNFVPLEGFVNVIHEITKRIPYLENWRSFTTIGTSFPSVIKKGISILPRYEWQLYKELIPLFSKSKLRLPAFGDYAITHSGEIPDLDWRIIKPAATIRYTIDDGWYLSKGKSLRDGPLDQCHEMCKALVKTQYYCGADFSYGDQFIQKCALDKTTKTRSHSIWRKMGTSHHIEKVIHDISNYYAF